MKRESIRSVLAFTGGIFLVLYLHFVPLFPASETSVHLDEQAYYSTNMPPGDSALVITTIKKNHSH